MGQGDGVWLPRQRTEGLLTDWVGDELVVVDAGTRHAHCLTGTLADVWSRCDGSHSVRGLAAELALDGREVSRLLGQLDQLGLLQAPAGRSERITRRALARNAAGAAGAAAGTLLLSVALPASASAASKLGTCAVAPNCMATLLNPGPIGDTECASGFCAAGGIAGALGTKYCIASSNCTGLGLVCGLGKPTCCIGTCVALVCVGNTCPGS
jgi:hypothetical protein